MTAITSKAPGKTILFGEHAVVYGFPAIAVPINSVQMKINIQAEPTLPADAIHILNRDTGQNILVTDLPEQDPIRATLRIIGTELKIDHYPATTVSISSTIPIASGLGSSAALAVALVRGFSQFLGFDLSDQEVNEIAFEVEKIHHGTPSGIDNTVIALNRPLFFVKGQPVEFLTFEKPLTLVIADTGIRSLTKETVMEVKARLEREAEIVSMLLSQIGSLTQTAKDKLIRADLSAIGDLMNGNHQLLRELGVSCLELDQLVSAARNAGALGAKLCGSGKGGNMIALAHPDQAENIRTNLVAAGAANVLIAEVK